MHIIIKTKSNTKELYSHIHMITSYHIGSRRLENGEVAGKELERAEALYDYLASVSIVKDTNGIQEITPAQPNLILLSDCDFTKDTITKAHYKIKVN